MQDSLIDSEWALEGAVRERAGVRHRLRRWGVDRVQLVIVLAAVLMAVAFCAILAYAVVGSQRSVMERVRLQNQHLAHTFKLHTTAAFELVDHTLRNGRRQWLEEGRLQDQWTLGEALPNFKKMILQVAVIDASGRLAASSIDAGAGASGVYLGDRDHFKAHLRRSTDQLYVGKPLIGRLSGRPSVQFSRPIFRASGEFAGVVVASVDPGFVGDLFAGPQVDGGASYGLLGDDGVPRVWVGTPVISLDDFQRSARVRHPEAGKLSGVYDAPASGDRPAAHWHVESLARFPLSVAVSTDTSAVMAQLRIVGMVAWVLGAFFVVCSGLGAAYLVRTLRHGNQVVRQLHESQLKAHSANEMKSRFLASVSHELRTPLNGVLGFSELVAMSSDPTQAAHYGRLIHKSAKHLHELVNTMLDLAKIEAGRMEVMRTTCDLRDLCEAVASMHRFAAEKKGLGFSVDYAPDLPPTIFTDRIKLMQVLNNVLHNAVKFTLVGHVALHVGLREDRWLFRIEDSGVGMAPEQLAGLFDRFRHSEFNLEAVTREQGGGLGMALCKELVELLAGRVVVRSAPGEGTTVEIDLPALGRLR